MFKPLHFFPFTIFSSVFVSTDHNFCVHTPSTIAAATLAASIGHHVHPEVLNQVLHMLNQITKIETVSQESKFL